MRTHDAYESQPPGGGSGHRRLLPMVGGGVVVIAVLAHLLGGGLLMHVGLPALLSSLGLGASAANFGGVVALVAVVAVKVLLVFGARRWWQGRQSQVTR